MKYYAVGGLSVFFILFLLGTVFSFNLSHWISVDNTYDFKRIIFICYTLISAVCLFFVRRVYFIKLSRQTLWLLTLFLLLALYSAYQSRYPFWGLIEIANLLLLFSVFLIFASSFIILEKETVIRWLYFGVLTFTILTFAKYLLFLLFSYLDTKNFDIHGLISGYVNVRFFNQLQAMVIPLLFLPCFFTNLTKFERISKVAIALHWVALLQTEARGAMLSLIVGGGLIWLFADAISRRRLFSIFWQSLIMGIIIWLVLIVAIPAWLVGGGNLQIRTSSSGRLDLWLYVLSNMSNQGWLGFGPMSFAWAEGKPLPNAHPHNSVMQLLYEYGVIVCVFVTLWILRLVYNQLSSITSAAQAAKIPYVYAMLSGLLYSQFSGVAVMPFAQLLLVFVIAQLVSFTRQQNYVLKVRGKLIFIAFVTLAAGVILHSYKHTDLQLTSFPRIWVNGLIGH